MSTKKTDNPYMMYPETSVNEEIAHYGRPGMKWGEHIYRNSETGALNRVGRRDTKRAKKAYETYAKMRSMDAKHDARKAEKARNRFDNETFKKYAKSARLNSIAADTAKKKIKDIDAGKLRIGRDFVVQRSTRYGVAFGAFSEFASASGPANLTHSPLNMLFGGASVDHVIEKSSKKK